MNTIINGSSYGTLPTTTRDRYTFVEWNTKVDGTGDTVTADTIVNLTIDHTLYAIWEHSKYTVTLDNQSAITAGSTSVTVTYDSDMPSITVPAKIGYAFNVYYSTTSAKIGLMYMHDYYYSYQAGGLNCGKNGSYSTCANSWLHLMNCDSSPATSWEWFMTRYGSQYGYTT